MGRKQSPSVFAKKPELCRDMYGFTLAPQHLEKYKKYIEIYKEEEEERSEKWKQFLETFVDSSHKHIPSSLKEDSRERSQSKGINKVRSWSEIRPSLAAIERSLNLEKKKKCLNCKRNGFFSKKPSLSFPPNDSDDEVFDLENSNSGLDSCSTCSSNSDYASNSAGSGRDCYTWREELECLVHGGLPMALRGELWQAFVGSNTRRIEGYYNALLAERLSVEETNNDLNNDGYPIIEETRSIEKWTIQIEKDLPRTFPGHPALDEDGRSALRRLLTAYACHNPSLGYCQAMNFIGGLLLLLMSEENAFWTLTCIMEDYFGGYYSEDMVEAQVDQLVFEEVVHECFPKLVSHLDKLGVQITLITGPWFLSVFVNVLPWESVLRVWDVLLYEGNRKMLFRTALALIDLHGPALLATKDAGDAVSLIQSLAASTFDSSQLVFAACTGYQRLDEVKLQELHGIFHAKVSASIHGNCKENHHSDNVRNPTNRPCKNNLINPSSAKTPVLDIVIRNATPASELQEQVKSLKTKLCQILEETKIAITRSEELETLLMEEVRRDTTSTLAQKIGDLELVLSKLKQAISEKERREHTLLQKMMQLEEQQRVGEDRRIIAERTAIKQRHVATELEEKYQKVMDSLAATEEKALMAECMIRFIIEGPESSS